MKTGYHAVYAQTYFEGIDDAKKHGFDFVQFDLGVPAYFLNGMTNDMLTEIRKYAEYHRVEITFHSPGDNVSLFCDYPFIRRGILDEFKYMLEKANILGGRHMTFHTGDYPVFRKAGVKSGDLPSEYYEGVLYDNLKTLISSCGDILICVENSGLGSTSRGALRRLISDTKKLYLTLDIAKMYTSDGKLKEKDLEFFSENKELIREIHIHDRNKELGSHQIVGDGFVDFSRFAGFLNQNTYLNFEVRPVESAKEAKEKFLDILK